jgi:outer membrane lipoprotein-sorting protein
MRTLSFTLLFMSALLLLNACGVSSTTKPYTNMRAVTAISAKVAAHYDEANPKNMKVSATLTEGSRAVSMNLVALDGQFHKGSLVATHLSFSMLSDGSKVWAIRATDDQYLNTDTEVWFDPGSDITL